jgi:hypothetical protein
MASKHRESGRRVVRRVYQHCSAEHLAHYLHEFAFRYSGRAKAGVSDMERSTRAIQGI